MKKPALLLLLVPTLLRADEVYLKGAGVLSGRILDQTETVVKVDVGDGIIGVPISHVDRIVHGRSPLDEFDERAARLKPDDVVGWKKLGAWATGQGLSSQSRRAYEKVLTVAPNDREARQALGFVELGGRWLTEEESYAAQGYVKYEGEWMTPAEAENARASAAQAQAREDAERRANEAEIAAREADARAQEAEERAREAEDRNRSYYDPVYWGGWGYGVTYWPSSPGVRHRIENRPSQLPSRTR